MNSLVNVRHCADCFWGVSSWRGDILVNSEGIKNEKKFQSQRIKESWFKKKKLDTSKINSD